MTRVVPVILAAGRGTRMRASRPKVLLPLGGVPIIRHCLAKATAAVSAADEIRPVIGYGEKEVRALLDETDSRGVPVVPTVQKEQLGSGHALELAVRSLNKEDIVLVLYGDAPLIRPATLKRLTAIARKQKAVWLGARMEKPQGYGRIVRDASGNPCAITEERDCSPEQRALKEVNTGFMAARAGPLRVWLKRILATERKNDQKEYLLTDVMQHAYADSYPIEVLCCENDYEYLGANDLVQLAQLEKLLQDQRKEALARQGVYLMHADSLCILGEEKSLRVGRDVCIGANVVLSGRVRLGDDVAVGCGSFVRQTTIGDRTRLLEFCHLDDARIGKECVLGPFARLRPGSRLKDRVHIGNFVEVKNSDILEGSKVSHLSYLGDARIGKHANIGAGTITCNYDGVRKHRTRIGEAAFVGSNTALVAPVTIGKGAVIGAGSVINKDVAAGSLALERSRQREMKNYAPGISKTSKSSGNSKSSKSPKSLERKDKHSAKVGRPAQPKRSDLKKRSD